MENEYEILCDHGIYEIRCSANEKVYVGQSNNLLKRRATHFNMLRKGRHYNYLLQKDWDLHGESSFSFRPLEFVYDLKELDYKEQWYINKVKDGFLYNLAASVVLRGRKSDNPYADYDYRMYRHLLNYQDYLMSGNREEDYVEFEKSYNRLINYLYTIGARL